MGEDDDELKSKRIVFVTVGTTCFDSLVRAVDTEEVRAALLKKGYTHLIIQMGAARFLHSYKGSGSIFETLKLRKPLIVVVNEDLMDNHQSELAEELAGRSHLFCARPQSLYQTILKMDLDSIIPYQPGDAGPVAKFIDRFLGFNDE